MDSRVNHANKILIIASIKSRCHYLSNQFWIVRIVVYGEHQLSVAKEILITKEVAKTPRRVS